VSTRVWGIAGLGVALAYLCSCALQGGVYRPRGMELDNPAFYLFPVLLAFPIGAAIVDRRRYRAARGRHGLSSTGARIPCAPTSEHAWSSPRNRLITA
jgi:hypothetical protein